MLVFALGSMWCQCVSDFALELDVSVSTYFHCILCELYLISDCASSGTQTAVFCLLYTALPQSLLVGNHDQGMIYVGQFVSALFLPPFGWLSARDLKLPKH